MDNALPVRVTPRSSRTAVIGELDGGVVALRLKAPPVEGAANAAVLVFVAELTGVAKQSVHLVRGARSRHKWIAVDGISADALRQLLLKAAR